MTKPEIKKIMAIVNSETRLDEIDLTCFMGFVRSVFDPIHTTKLQVAALIRYQCAQMNGELDMEALAEICHYGKKKFIIID